MNKALSIFLLGSLTALAQAEGELCSASSAGPSCSKLQSTDGSKGYSKKISSDIEQFLIENTEYPEISNVSTMIFYYTLPSSDGSARNSELTIKNTKIDLPLDQNEGGRIRQNVVGPYSHLKLSATAAGNGEINGLRIGIGDSSISALATDLKNQYLQSGSLETTMSETGDLKIAGDIYMGNGSSFQATLKGKINFSAKMQNAISYPKTRYYVGDEVDNDSFAYNFYNDNAPNDGPKDDTSPIAQDLNLNFTSNGFANSGQLYISGAGTKAQINVGTGNFENGVFSVSENDIEHHSATMVDALNNPIDSAINKHFTDQLNYKEGRISVFDYAKANITGNFKNGTYGSIVLVDGGTLNISGNFTNEGWILSGAVDSRDFGYINVSGTSELKQSTQIALITNPNTPIIGNKAYLLLKSDGGITDNFTKKTPPVNVANNGATDIAKDGGAKPDETKDTPKDEVAQNTDTKPQEPQISNQIVSSPMVSNPNIHLFNATKNNGALINVSENYLSSNLIFDTTLSSDKKEFYVTLRPTQEAKAKSVEQLIKEAQNSNKEQQIFQKNQQEIAEKKIAFLKLTQQQHINEAKLQEYQSIVNAEFMNSKLQKLEEKIKDQESELAKLKPAYDAANAQKNAKLQGVPLKDQAPIRKKYNNHPDIKGYEDLQRKIQDQKYALEDIQDALPKKSDQETKLKQLEEINSKYIASSKYIDLLEDIGKKSNSYVNALDNAMRDTIEGLKFFATDDEIYKLKAQYDAEANKEYASFDEFLEARTQKGIENIAQSLGQDVQNLKKIADEYIASITTQYKSFEDIVKDYREKRSAYNEEKTAKQAELTNNRKAANADFQAITDKLKNAPTSEMITLQQEINQKEEAKKNDAEIQKLLEEQSEMTYMSDEWYNKQDEIDEKEKKYDTYSQKSKLAKLKAAQSSKKYKPEDILAADEKTLQGYVDALNTPAKEGDAQGQYTIEELKAYAQALADANLALNGDSKKGIKSGGTKLYEELQQKLSTLGEDTIAKLEEIVANIESMRNKKEEFISTLLAAQGQDSKMKRKMDILNGIKNLSDDLATSVIAHIKDEDTLQNMVNEVEENIDNLSTQAKNNSIAKSVNLISSTLTQNRLALQSNPFNPNNPIARAIKNLSKNHYAADDNIQIDAFDALQEAFSEEEEQTMDVWASLIGGYASANGSSAIYGGSVGYDAMIGESVILGVFGTYAYAKSNNQGSITAKSHNAQLGLYSRFFKDHHEFDANISHNIGFVNQDRIMQIAGISSAQTSDYINQSTNLALTYGYAFLVGEESNFYIKPQAGVNLAYNIQGNYEEKGLKFEQEGEGVFQLNINAALEFRKYFKNGGYFYVIPGVDYLTYNSQKSIAYKLGGVEIITPLSQNNKIYYTAMAGGEVKISKSIFAFGSLGAKIASDEQYYNGSVGMRYKF